MKRILFLILAVLAIAGCSTDEKDPPFSDIYEDNTHKYLSMDSIHYYRTEKSDDKCLFAKYKRDTRETIWEKEIIVPSPISADLGYGESKVYKFSGCGIEMDTDNFLFITLWFGEQNNRSGIGIYTLNGDFISNIIFEGSKEENYIRYTGSTRWNNGSVIIHYKSEKKYHYMIIDKSGKIVETNECAELPITKDPQYCWERGYIYYKQDIIYICDLDLETKRIDISDIIKNMYPQETNKPKATIKETSVTGDIITLSADLTFYDGTKKSTNIKINFKTLEVIQ